MRSVRAAWSSVKALSLVCCLVSGGQVRADPALWTAKGQQAAVYLFGSVHALRPGTSWLTASIQRAITAARSCWFEVDLAGMNPDDVQAAMAMGLDPDRTLMSQLTASERTRLGDIVTRPDIPGGQATIEGMRPWLAAVLLAAADVAVAGYSVEDGVDMTILKNCQAADKSIYGLETAQEQLRGMSELPQETGLRMLRGILKEGRDTGGFVDRIAQAWVKGDMQDLAAIIEAGEADEPRDVAVFKTRNIAWASRIAALAAGSESIFITVGAGHLVGPGNLRALLEARGIKVGKIEP